MRLKNLLRKEGIKPDLVSLDQCFMKDPELVRLIVQVADLNKGDTVLEIGAGTGVLTSKLSKRAGRVIAVEKDPRLYNLLSSMVKAENVRIVIADVKRTGFFNANKIVSNPPYTILDWLFNELNNYEFDSAVLTIPEKFYKKQVSKYEDLRVDKIRNVPRSSFYPEPKVNSVIVKIIRS